MADFEFASDSIGGQDEDSEILCRSSIIFELHVKQPILRDGRSLAASQLRVPGLLSLTECSRLLPLSPVPLRAPGLYLSHLQLSAGQRRGW